MNLDSIEIANSILDYCIKKNYKISNLALQKFIFILNVKSNFALLDREEFEEWKICPVIPKVYYHYCYNGGLDIEEVLGNKLKNLPSWFYKTLDEIIKIHSSKPYELNAIIEKERIKNES